jgi:coenzyme F420 hydrogenase subunit beta
MGRAKSIQDIVRCGLCVSCGACVSAAPQGTMRMVLEKRRGVFLPEIFDAARVSGTGPEYDVCPGKGAPVVRMGRELFGDAGHHRPELGWYRELVACHSNDKRILERASSGGVMTDIARFLLERGHVDGVTVSKFTYGPGGPRTASFIAHDLDGLLAGQGSKYCPTTTNELVAACAASGKRHLFLATPCQVLALRLAQAQRPELRETFPLTMANFCGGYRDFRDLDDLLERNGFDGRAVASFRFRGGGQPGSMLALDSQGRTLSRSYPEYGRGSLLPRVKRCVFCVDGTGLLADFACGDAWLDRFANKDGLPWSVVVLRSLAARDIFEQMAKEGRIATEPITEDEALHSQRHNLDSKITRQHRRMTLYRLFGATLPDWDMPLPRSGGSWLDEIRTILGKHKRAMLYRLRYRLGLRRRHE